MGKNKHKKKKKNKPVIIVTYPNTVAQCIDDKLKFRKDTINAINEFRTFRPWKGTLWQRKNKIVYLHLHLCEIYGNEVGITFNPSLKSSVYIPDENIIVLRDCSVVTFLHEFAHSLGKDENDACRWSLNLFKRCFPKAFANNKQMGHMLVRKKNKPKKARKGTVVDTTIQTTPKTTQIFENIKKTQVFEDIKNSELFGDVVEAAKALVRKAKALK